MKITTITAAFLASCVLAGCATTIVEGDGVKAPRSAHGVHTAHGSFYKFAWSEPPVDKCSNGHALYRVRTYTNPLYMAASLLSLGLYVPLTLEWWCDATPEKFDDREVYSETPH